MTKKQEILAVAGILGTLVTGFLWKSVEFDEKLESREAVHDTLFYNDSLAFAKISKLEKAIKLKDRQIAAMKVTRKKRGIFPKTWDLFFGSGK